MDHKLHFLNVVSILIDGSPFGFSCRSQGLRHRYTTIFLFVVVMDALIRMLTRAIDRGLLLSGFLASYRNTDHWFVSHLRFDLM